MAFRRSAGHTSSVLAAIRGRWWLACLPLLLLWSAAASAQTPLMLDDYWAELEALLLPIEALANLPESEQAEARADLVIRLEALTAVALPDGQTVPVSQAHLQALLADTGSDPDQIAHALRQQLENREQWPPALVSQLDQQTLQTILSRPEFRYEVAEPTWWQRLWERIQLWFWEWVGQLAPNAMTTNWVRLMVLAVTGFLILLILLYVLRRLQVDFAAEAQFNRGDDPHLDNITADTAWQRAQESSDLGDYRQAVRYLYLSTLLLLEERDLLRYDRALTNREYLSRLAHRPDLAAILRDVVDVFDRVWYGYQPLSEGEYGRFADRVQILKQQKGERP